jgi:deoxyribodipyrimidine photo-lyase
MRQLREEGWIHNRARLITASFLAKTLYLDWRLGARHFLDLLVDGDVASNVGNWQWVAGTGADTRPNRVLNPMRQAIRFDPRGDYVRRYVSELAELPSSQIHRPWTLDSRALRGLRYPPPIVDLGESAHRFRRARTARS